MTPHSTGLLAAAAVTTAALHARADPTALTFFDQGRTIPHTGSASRDAPTVGTMFSPRTVMTAGAEFAIAALHTRRATMRMTFSGLLEIESDQRAEEASLLFSPVGARFWRGAYAYSLVASSDSWAAGLCGACVVEASVTARHETDHVTANKDGPTDVRDVPIVGDEVGGDVAVARPSRRWIVVGRLHSRFFIPGQSGYRHGHGIDLQLRRTGRHILQPFVSAFGEYLTGANVRGQLTPDVYRVRGLLGIAVPARLGDILVFVAADAGHRKGLAVLTEERTLGVGVQLTLGQLPTRKGAP